MLLNDNEWKGYSIDEIRIMRMVNLAKIEIDKNKLSHITSPIVNKTKTVGSSPILRKLFGALDMMDYAVIAFSIGSRVFKLFRRRK